MPPRPMRPFLLALALVCAGCGGSQVSAPPWVSGFGTNWTPVGNAPAVSPRPCPALDCIGMGDPALARLADGSLVMWYTTGGDMGGPLIVRARVDAALGVANAPDAPVIPVGAAGTWDRFVETVSVVPDSASGHFRLFYLGYADTGFVAPAIGAMLSNDSAGTQWVRPAAPIYRPAPGAWDGVFITGPTALGGPDGIWRIYYTGAGTTVGIGLLTSMDGVTWTPHPSNPVFERRLGEWDEAVIEPCVRYLGGRWWMWYSGYREPLADDTRIGIGLAVSDDGVRWTRVGSGAVLPPGPAGSWYSHRVLAPDIMEEPDGSLLMAAYGQVRSDVGVIAGRIGFWRSR